MKLANNALRTKNMIALLQDMGIKVGKKDEGKAEVSCKDELVILKPASQEEAENLAGEIQTLLQTGKTKPAVQRFTLNDLLNAEIDAATCVNVQMTEKNKRSLRALLPILELDFMLDAEQEYLDIKLPSIAYAPLFGSLTYKYLKLDGETLKFNVKEFLKDHREELVLIDGEAPLLLCDAEQFEKKKVFYAQKRLDENEVEVTPHVFIPYAAKPPAYTFVLDTSGSMVEKFGTYGTRLQQLQKSVIKFAEALYAFHPDATINIKQFNNTIGHVGSYKKGDLTTLRMQVNGLKAEGGTNLFTATINQLSSFSSSTKHTNVLLFTDGQNTDSAEQDLESKIEALQNGSPLILARNKFFIISYGATQPPVLHTVAQLFGSPVIDTDSPDFVAALSENDKMQEWAAGRELFTCRFVVKAGLEAELEAEPETTYACCYDLSGQFTALKPVRCKDNEELHLTLVDGDDAVILDDRKPAVKPVVPVVEQLPMQTPVLPGSVKTATSIGVFSLGTQETAKPPVHQITDPTAVHTL
ncbi:VWA domain-containing protein [Legionella feeleii]|uniref:Marine proteobacterial sortase target protein n=1 Tax=Legionella feeleii TaxID=453 RepID=A0A378IRP6_9GAMM|nr:VWA domain-containing protein [Legionella feeleii]STX37916.1 marine proteobacterial sortase target protein [Legionella feeleii]